MSSIAGCYNDRLCSPTHPSEKKNVDHMQIVKFAAELIA